MTFEFKPTDSKEIFVGRDHKRDIFMQILSGDPLSLPEWVIHIPGPGGVGKTRLLERLGEDALALSDLKILATENLVDFYKTTNQTVFGFLQTVVEQIGLAYFERFRSERKEFERLLSSEGEPEQRQEREGQVLEAFLQDYEELLRDGYKVVWLLDTCEEMHAVEGFVLDVLLSRIKVLEEKLHQEKEISEEEPITRQSIVVIAGRKQLDFPKGLSEEILEWKLAPLTLEQMENFFDGSRLGSVSVEKIGQLHSLTGGHPLYVALSYDWLRNEVGTWEELLSLEEPLGEKLVKWVRRLDTDEKRAIFHSAVAWRRVEPSLLSTLLNLVDDEARKLIEQLSKFSFVKYRPSTENFPGAFQLHDEMRDLVQAHVLSQEGEDARHSLTEKIIAWYEGRINDQKILEGQRLPTQADLSPDEARALLAEWLFYQSKLDLEKAFEIHEKLFRNAIHYLDLDFADLLNQEVERFKDNLTAQQKSVLRFREALVAFRREDFVQADYIWHSLIRQNALHPKMRATTLMLLVELDAYIGKPNEALEHARESEKIYLTLLNKETDSEQCDLLENERGQLYNNWGYACRVKGDLDNALINYDKALKAGGRRKNIARTLNNMGFVYLRQGDIVEARTHVGRALQIRRELKIPYELGLGYNTLGIIMEESGRLDNASDSYSKALSSFDAARSERGKALVLVNLGRIERTTNRYEQAIDYLKQAETVFKRKDDVDNLIKVYNELGCTYRDRGENGDWEKAEDYLKDSLDLTNRLNRAFERADNWEDLSILYVFMAEDARGRDDEAYETYAESARVAVKEVENLSEEQGFMYLLAKKERTLGDLDYEEEDYEQAFEHYFEACHLMAKAKRGGWLTPVLAERRFEQMVDRLQEQLQALPTQADTQKYTQRMLDRLDSQKKKVREELSILAEFLNAAKQMVEKTPRIQD
jgi:tetratricopeptide (TPR) repeat protein